MDENESIEQELDRRIHAEEEGERGLRDYLNRQARIEANSTGLRKGDDQALTADRMRVLLAEDVPVPPAASEGIGAVTGEDPRTPPYPFLRGNGEAKREKTWAECTPEERIERLRGATQEVQRDLRHLMSRVGLLLEHRHGEHGELLAPIYGDLGQCAPYGWKPFDPLA